MHRKPVTIGRGAFGLQTGSLSLSQGLGVARSRSSTLSCSYRYLVCLPLRCRPRDLACCGLDGPGLVAPSRGEFLGLIAPGPSSCYRSMGTALHGSDRRLAERFASSCCVVEVAERTRVPGSGASALPVWVDGAVSALPALGREARQRTWCSLCGRSLVQVRRALRPHGAAFLAEGRLSARVGT
jgi:hypothetical protein